MDEIVQEIDALKRSDFDWETNITTDKDIKSTDEKIRFTAEKVFNNNIDSYVKVSQQRIIEKLNEVAERKLQTIQSEKTEQVSLFEDFKVRQKNNWSAQKLLMDEVVQGVSKSIEEIHILKKANMSKSDKIKKCEETLKEMSTKVESKHSQQLSVNQIEEKVETLFFDLVKKQSVSNRINQNSLVNQDDSTAGYSESVQDKVQPKYKKHNLPRSRVKCDIVILMDSNRRFISKKRISPNQKVYMVPCGSINQAKEILSNPVFFGQHTLVLHFGVSHFETMSPQESCKNMRDVLLLCKEKFKTTKVIVSGITPRKDELNSEVKLANQLIMNEISKESFKDIIYVDSSNLLDDPSLLHNKKHLQRDSSVKILAANLKRKLPKFKMVDSNKQPMQRTHQNKQDEHKAPEVKFGQQQEAVENVSMSDVLSQLKQMNSLLVKNISAPKYPTSPQPNFWFNHPGQLNGHYPTQY